MRIRRIFPGCVGEGFYPSRQYNAGNLTAPMQIRMRRGCVRFWWCVRRGRGRTPPLRRCDRFYEVAAGVCGFAIACCTILQSPSATAPFTQGSLFVVQTRDSSKRTTLLLIRRFAPPSPQGEGFLRCVLIFSMVQAAPELFGGFEDMRVFGFLVDADQLAVLH